MAISNIYKPGWRSRRRSRLSLVERAVPRLGRISGSENASGSTTPSALAKTPDPDNDRQDEVNQPVLASSTEQEQERVEVSSPATLIRHSEPTSFGGSGGAQETEQASSAAEPSAPPQADSEPPETSSHGEQAIATGTGFTAAEAASSPSPDMSSKQEPPPPVDNTEKKGFETGDPLPLPKALEGSWDLDGMSAAVKADADPAQIRLDWRSLIASGLVDPRDRAQPLPANMDEIAKGLIRQALSDQSSWRDRIILVSSARENRAKSMAAINFAFALTTIDRHSVVLLDANMDGSGVGPHLGAAGYQGLTTALCDGALEIEDIALKTNLDRLTLVSSGGFEEDILDRFASRRMLEILRFLAKDPETLLVIDAPPILTSQEATVLSVIAGQVVLVVEAGTTNEASINHALKRIGDRHNVSLVLSENSGIVQDEPTVTQTPASRRLALPMPKDSFMKRRRLKKAVASFVIGFGLSTALGINFSLPEPGDDGRALKEWSPPDRSAFTMEPVAPKIGGVAR